MWSNGMAVGCGAPPRLMLRPPLPQLARMIAKTRRGRYCLRISTLQCRRCGRYRTYKDMTVIYHDEDGDLSALAGRQIGVIGYGNMGRPVALNLRDSGLRVLVTEPRPEKQELAISEGFALTQIEDLVRTSDVIMPLLRDEAMPKIYLESVSPYLRRGQALVF